MEKYRETEAERDRDTERSLHFFSIHAFYSLYSQFYPQSLTLDNWPEYVLSQERAEPGLSITVSLPLKPTFVLLRSEESLSNMCFLIMQNFRARKPADMAMPTAVPIMAYLISGGQGGIEQGALISHHPAKVFHTSFYIGMKSKVKYLDLYITRSKLLHARVFSCSVVSSSFIAPWNVAHQAPLSMEFPRQEHWSGLPFPPPRYLHDPGVEPTSLTLTGRFFTTEPPEKSQPTEASLIFQSPGSMLLPYSSPHTASPLPGTPTLVPSAVGIIPKWLVAPFSAFLPSSSLILASVHPCVCQLPALASADNN